MESGDTKNNLQEKLEKDLFHVVYKVPSGDGPYVRAKYAQLVDRDPEAAVVWFWKAINCGDRVCSALKDMAVVLKQLDRSEQTIEAIKSFQGFCPKNAQESLDSVLIELYKPSEQNTYGDIDAVFMCLEENYGTKQEDVILYGQSVGSGPTLELAARLLRLRAVVLCSPILSRVRVMYPVKRTYWFDIYKNQSRTNITTNLNMMKSEVNGANSSTIM